MQSDISPLGTVNWLGLATLYKRETLRFMKVWNQTMLAPVITTLLFLAILMLGLGGQTRLVEGLPFNQFIAPGLIMMAIVQNAFANTSSSLMLSKIQGVIIDILMPPLSPGEIVAALIAGGITRGLLVGVTVSIAVYSFVPFTLAHPGIGLFHVIAASMLLAQIGIFSAIWSQTFDQLSVITNYLITPLSFLSGTFYSIRHLPVFWYNVCHFNPFFYMIDGFRYAITGYSDGSHIAGIIVLTLSNIVLWFGSVWMLKKGYRLKT